MIREKISDVASGYDLVADEYARRISDELQHKPLDRRRRAYIFAQKQTSTITSA